MPMPQQGKSVVEICEAMERERRSRLNALSESTFALASACQRCKLRDASGCEQKRCSVYRVQQEIESARRKFSRRCTNPDRMLDRWSIDEFVLKTARKAAV